MAIVRWTDPLRELANFQDRINRVFTGAGDDGLETSGAWVPPVDIYQNGDHELVLKAELPDMTREDIDITIDKSTLVVKGEKKLASEVKEDRFHRIERSYGNFVRSFAVPNTFDTDKINAAFKNGVLTVTLTKKETAKPRQIKVETAV